ncbi:MAG: hypothetical protein A2039_02980 [Candidatus Melainabacteria bacterium GWA2_34_9]|nr:MAG: hypothetical protein A2039_02980 [Candidatus Melainabacteria bacterium GWA2_34_9]
MTTITRINSNYSSGGGAYYGYTPQRQTFNSVSIWGNTSFGSNYNYVGANNGIYGVSYARPGSSFVPMNQVMTAPFGANADLLGTEYRNPFASSSFSSTSVFSSGYPERHSRGHSDISHRRSSTIDGHDSHRSHSSHDSRRNFLSLTGEHSNHHSGHRSNNIFRNHAGSHHSNDISIKRTSTRTGTFGSQTTSNRSTSIHTPSVDFNTRDIKSGNSSISRTNVSGHVDGYRQTNQHIVTPTSDLNKTRQVIDTPTERITRTRTQGTIWV